MELQVRTLQGTAKLQVLADTSVLDLKRQLHQQYSSTLDVPEPGRQRLVGTSQTRCSGLNILQQVQQQLLPGCRCTRTVSCQMLRAWKPRA
jgi:hypothetical protein